MVTEDALGLLSEEEPADFLNDPRAVWAAIDEVAHKDELTPLWVDPKAIVAEPIEQLVERLKLTMDVTNDVEGS